jgi:drug/metabolite transporter (DMT)-like permease
VAEAKPTPTPSAPSQVSGAGLAMVATACVIWSIHWPINKFALTEIPPLMFRTSGIFIASFILLGLGWARVRVRGIPKGELKSVVICGLLNFTFFHGTLAYGLYFMQASQAVIIGYSYPVWMVLFGRLLFGEPMTLSRVMALAFGFGAVVTLFFPTAGAAEVSLIGAAIMFANCIFSVSGTVYYKRNRWSLTTLELIGWQMLIGSLPLMALAAFIETPPVIADLSTNVIVALLFSIFIAQALGHWAFFGGLARMSAVITSLISLMNPVIGVFASAWILSEPITAQKLLALVFTLVSLAFAVVGPAGFKMLAALLARPAPKAAE